MSTEPNIDKKSIEKLSIDKPGDFRFHAAYLAYSETCDKNTSEEVRAKLNEALASLSNSEIDYETFYRKIASYRTSADLEGYRGDFRARIETARKKDWRKKEQRSAREARHKK